MRYLFLQPNQMGRERLIHMHDVGIVYVICLHAWQASVLRCTWKRAEALGEGGRR